MNQQVFKKEIEIEFQKYLDAIFKKDFVKSLEYIDEELFKHVPKEDMLKFFEDYYNDPELSVALQESAIINISNLKKIDSKKYSYVEYKLVLHLVLIKEDEESIEEFKERTIDIKSGFEEIFGTENFEYIEELDYFKVSSFEKAIAINKSNSITWKFIVYDEEELLLLNKIIPNELLLELGFHLNN